jgi:hypothetical protein
MSMPMAARRITAEKRFMNGMGLWSEQLGFSGLSFGTLVQASRKGKTEKRDFAVFKNGCGQALEAFRAVMIAGIEASRTSPGIGSIASRISDR